MHPLDWHGDRGLSFLQLGLRELAHLCYERLPLSILQALPKCNPPVIGMCLTGGFVLSLMADESVIAPVASQPSLPVGITASHRAALGISADDLAAAKAREVPLLAVRISDDKTSPAERFETLRQEFGDTPEVIRDDASLCWKRGKTLETIQINSEEDNPSGIRRTAHPVLTLELRESGHPTREAFNRVLFFCRSDLTSSSI